MEKYEVLQRLQPGALGTVLVAGLKAERNAKDRFVIKQVECIDEKQANEALKEAMGLLQLHHSSICAYKEMFVTWDNEISSLYLCLVMQHSGQVDLSSLIKTKRQKPEKIADVVKCAAEVSGTDGGCFVLYTQAKYFPQKSQAIKHTCDW